MPEPGRLIVVATPIGNLDDISPRAAAALRDADLVACEDTRRTATLLRHVGATTPMVAVHEHNEASRSPDLVRRIVAGETVALVSDAGMPVVSDPGGRLVAAAIAHDVAVEVVPGPSAVVTALVASGFAAEPFTFVGFFPRKHGERLALFDRLATTIVGFESPKRLGSLLADLAAAHPTRRVAVCRELTKLHEEIVRGSAEDLAARYGEPPRGEVTIVVEASAMSANAGDQAIRDAVAVLLESGLGPASAADVIVRLGIGPRNAAYREALAADASRHIK